MIERANLISGLSKTLNDTSENSRHIPTTVNIVTGVARKAIQSEVGDESWLDTKCKTTKCAKNTKYERRPM